MKEKYQKLSKKYQKLKEKSKNDDEKLNELRKKNEDLLKEMEKAKGKSESEEVSLVTDLRQNIHNLNSRLNDLSKENFELNEQKTFLQFQMKVFIFLTISYYFQKIKNLRDQENELPHNRLLEDKLDFLSQKNEKLALENNKLVNKMSILSGQIFELVKNFKKKILDFNNFALRETETFKKFKEEITHDLNSYIEKVLRIFFFLIKILLLIGEKNISQ